MTFRLCRRDLSSAVRCVRGEHLFCSTRCRNGRILPMGTPVETLQELEELRRLKEIWDSLERLVVKCNSAKRVTERDEKRHRSLLGEARTLYGRIRPVVGTAGMQWGPRTFDAFQHVLGQPSVYGVVKDSFDAYLWRQLWSAGDSVIGQAIGRLEAEEGRGRLPLDAETVARWAPLVNLLENMRQRLSWLLTRPRLLGSLVDRIEGSPLYRVASIVTTFGALIALLLVALGGVAVLINFLG